MIILNSVFTERCTANQIMKLGFNYFALLSFFNTNPAAGFLVILFTDEGNSGESLGSKDTVERNKGFTRLHCRFCCM